MVSSNAKESSELRHHRGSKTRMIWMSILATFTLVMCTIMTTWWIAEMNYEGKWKGQVAELQTKLDESQELRNVLREQRDEARDYGDQCSGAVNAAMVWYELGTPERGKQAIQRQVDECLAASGREVSVSD